MVPEFGITRSLTPAAAQSAQAEMATVYIVDDDAAVRESLCLLVESVGLRATAFGSAADFLEQCSPVSAGCIVLDIRMPGISGLELQERLNAAGITLPVIIITGHGDITMAVRAMKAGAMDFIQKPFSDQELLDQIHLALERDAQFRADRARFESVKQRTSSLSPRERTVMDLVVSGMSNKAIASELGLSQKTVEVHRAHVMDKMQAGSLAELVQMCILGGKQRPN